MRNGNNAFLGCLGPPVGPCIQLLRRGLLFAKGVLLIAHDRLSWLDRIQMLLGFVKGLQQLVLFFCESQFICRDMRLRLKAFRLPFGLPGTWIV